MFQWISDYFDHKETLANMRREDAIAGERYRQEFWDKVYADMRRRDER